VASIGRDGGDSRRENRNAGRKRGGVAVRVRGGGGETGVAGWIRQNHNETEVAAGISREVGCAEEDLAFAKTAAVAGDIAEKLQMINGVRPTLKRAAKRDVPQPGGGT